MDEEIIRVVEICRGHKQRFKSFEEGRRAFQRIAGLTLDESSQIAEHRSYNSGAMWGLHYQCRSACMAIDWLEYHGQPFSQEAFDKLLDEFKDSIPGSSILGFELKSGAWWVLLKCIWDGTSI